MAAAEIQLAPTCANVRMAIFIHLMEVGFHKFLDCASFAGKCLYIVLLLLLPTFQLSLVLALELLNNSVTY